jgi:AhpD family alkylhydroperoxidase
MKPRIEYARTNPDALKSLVGVTRYLRTSTLDARLRALIEIRVSQINGCAYCLDMHCREARELGEDQQRLDCLAAWREAPLYTARERAALAWAEAVTNISHGPISDELFRLVREEFGEAELVDLNIAVAQINTWNRMAIPFHTPIPERAPAEPREVHSNTNPALS